MPEAPQMNAAPLVVTLTSDLTVASMVRGAAERVGATSAMALDVDSLFRRLGEAGGAALVLVNLETRGLEIALLMERIAALEVKPVAVIAIGPHVHEAKLQAAREAGCDKVLSKGGFHAQAAELIAAYLGSVG
jgi:CheY-like chemotaxis protein